MCSLYEVHTSFDGYMNAGTNGGFIDFRCADSIVVVEVVNGQGQVRKLDMADHSDALKAASVSMGLLGAFTHITINVPCDGKGEYFDKFWKMLLPFESARLQWGQHWPSVEKMYGGRTIDPDFVQTSHPKFGEWKILRAQFMLRTSLLINTGMTCLVFPRYIQRSNFAIP